MFYILFAAPKAEQQEYSAVKKIFTKPGCLREGIYSPFILENPSGDRWIGLSGPNPT